MIIVSLMEIQLLVEDYIFVDDTFYPVIMGVVHT